MEHQSVLLHESIEGLNIIPGDIFVDLTVGRGGHSALVAEKFGQSVKIIGIDADTDSIEASQKRLEKYSADFVLRQGNFKDLASILLSLDISAVNKILFDLGWNTNQFEESGRGFSFQKDEPLNMSYFGSKADFTAGDIVNGWSEEDIANVLFGYGEESFSRRIARAIVAERGNAPIETTARLAYIVSRAVPVFYRHRKIHPATKTFQALRIAVNGELTNLKEGLEESFKVLAGGGRIAVISFHSLEDRIVKQFFKQKETEGLLVNINKKPIVPTDEEVRENPRSRSAKLRIIEKK